MRKFYLRAVKAEIPDDNIIVVEGFVKAEAKAYEMCSELIKAGYSYIDTYVCISESKRDVKYLDADTYILKADYYGDITWFKNLYGTYCYLYYRLINEAEEAELEKWRNEKDLHVCDLSEDNLKKLRGEICLGSMYLSDYDNSFYIDTEEVSDYAEDYERFLEEEGLEDTPQQFAEYIGLFLTCA